MIPDPAAAAEGAPLYRRDPVTGRWTIFVSGRSLAQYRPATGDAGRRGFCPFCAGNEAKTPHEVHADRPAGGPADSGRWRVRVVPNKFPALDPTATPAPSTVGLYDRIGGFGIHEVVIESPLHEADFPSFDQAQSLAVVKAWQARTAAIRQNPSVRYIMLFRNRGSEAGASLEHPHSQLIALPILPRLVMTEIAAARRYYEWKERCVFCDIVNDELAQGVRIIAETPALVAIAPYASRFPYEMWILPRRHSAHFHDASPTEIADLAAMLRDLLYRLDRILPAPPYNLILHTAPCQEGDCTHYHWHVEIMPRLVKVAGFEWGTGFYLNPILPEEAAARLAVAASPGARS